jgi:GTP pyrophosphokinase
VQYLNIKYPPKMIYEHKTDYSLLKKEFDKFVKNNSENFRTSRNAEKVVTAFDFATKALTNMYRFQGKPYILYNLEIAKIVVQEIGLGAKSAIAALLYDVSEKTEYSLEDINRHFGEKISVIVEGLTKIKKAEFYDNDSEATIFRQILFTVSEDIRVLFVKIAAKLNDLRNLENIIPQKKSKLVSEAINIYVPLSHRLGLYDIKSEMEDICLKYNNPMVYDQLKDKLKSSERERMQFINRTILPIKEILDKHNIDYKIESRSKSISSIWKKMQTKKVSLEEVYDLFALRIIFNEKNDEKFEALYIGSLISSIYPEKKDRTRNWLDSGKDTGYRALHLTVMSHDGKWVEIQIRSTNMHEAAEHGFASHWKYKGIKDKKTQFDEKVNEIIELFSENKVTAEDFLDKIKLNLLTTEIYVYTPKGKIVDLPIHSTALDFAFKIHTNIALKAISAKINSQLASLDTVLLNGDQVEIITAQNQTPQKKWIDFVTTHKAQITLKNIFKEERKLSIDKGKQITEYLLSIDDENLLHESVEKLYKGFKLKNKEEFFYQIGENKISNTEIIDKFEECCPARKTKFWKIKSPRTKIKADSTKLDKLLYDSYQIANCCNPSPGEKVIAINEGELNKVIIHKEDCPTVIVEQSKGKVAIPVKWTSYTALSVLREYYMVGRDKKGILNKITSVIAQDLSANIRTLTLETGNKIFKLRMTLFLKDTKSSLKLLEKIKKIEEITEITMK